MIDPDCLLARPARMGGRSNLLPGRLQVIRRKGSDDSVQPLSVVEIRALRKERGKEPAGLRHVFVSERGAPLTANDSLRRSAVPWRLSGWAK
jgi:hypothetical protein